MIGADDNLSVDVDQVGQLGGLFLSFDYFCLNRSIQKVLTLVAGQHTYSINKPC